VHTKQNSQESFRLKILDFDVDAVYY